MSSAATPDPTPRAGRDAPVVVSIDPDAHDGAVVAEVLAHLREAGLRVEREHAGAHCHAWTVRSGGESNAE